ncbi:MAG: glycine-rich domain-containing protein [Myxococcota bacterium]
MATLADVSATDFKPENAGGKALMERVLAFEAPYLESRFLQYRLAADAASARSLFQELKRYLFLAADASASMPMVSALVDAAWHQFILFTEEYRAFCEDVIGSYQHHGPRVAGAAPSSEPPLDPATFFHAYREHFGPPPDVWHNERCLRPETRLVHPFDTRFDVEVRDRVVRLRRHRSAGTAVVCVVSARAGDAVRFIAEHDVFLVRELPGLRGVNEQLALLTPLVEHDILHLAF